MRNETLGDVLNVRLHAAASVWLGAWVAPLRFNAGKALAEVSEGRTTNGFFEWLARHCRTAEFSVFIALVLSVIPPAGLNVPDPEEPRVGFELLRLMAVSFGDLPVILGEFVPLLAILITGALAHLLTRNPRNGHAAKS